MADIIFIGRSRTPPLRDTTPINHHLQTINHNMKSNLLFFFLLLFSSCTSWRTTHKSLMHSDSLRQVSHLTLRTTAIPESRTFLQVPAADLCKLPAAAVYTSKSGQATATVRFIRDTLYVTATCDSLQQLVYEYQQQIEKISLSGQNSRKESKKEAVFFLIIQGVILISFLTFARNRIRDSRWVKEQKA